MPIRFLAALLAFAAVTVCRASPTDPEAEASRKLAKVFALDGQVQEFLKKARAADRIADPLARCLAFPDFPGNEWPAGLAKAHCEFNLGKRIGAEDIRSAIETGRLAELEQQFAADLARHFSKRNFSEVIHGDFDAFDGKDDSEKLSIDWVNAAPHSPYALVARGEHFLGVADNARAGLPFSEISEANIKIMAAAVDSAVDFYQKALAIEPRLLPAHVGLVMAGRQGSRADIELLAFEQGQAVDPLCQPLNSQRVVGLAPRWGGDYDQMISLAMQVLPRVSERPLLALVTTLPRYDGGDALARDGRHAEAARILGPALLASTQTELFETMASSVVKLPTAKPFEAAAYAIAATRFGRSRKTYARFRGRLLLHDVKDPEWALPSLLQAIGEEPDNGSVHLLLGDAYVALNRLPEANREYILAMRDESTRAVAMRSLPKATPSLDAARLDPERWIEPAEAIKMAEASAPGGAPGVFVITVQASGAQGGMVYLNSLPDYRDPRNLSIALHPSAADAISKRLNTDLRVGLQGKRIIVTGVVRRVMIQIQQRNRMPGAFYYQTHVVVDDPKQVELAE